MSLKAKLEAVIYAAEEPVTLAQLAALFAGEALEWKAEQDAASATEADPSAKAPVAPIEDLPLLSADFEGLELDQAAAAGPAVEPVQPAAETSAETGAAAVGEESDAGGETGSESAEINSGANSEAGLESAAELGPADEAVAEVDAKRLARLRDREVRAILRQLLDELIAEYASSGRGVEIREIAGGFRMATKPEYHDAVRSFVKSLKPALKLSLPALETLAVIAYKQPVTAPEVNEIRGVDSSAVFGSLLARKLIATAGRKPVIGRPILYKTTREFLLRFGLKEVSELPSMEEFEKMAAAELEEPELGAEGESAAEIREDLTLELEEQDGESSRSETEEGAAAELAVEAASSASETASAAPPSHEQAATETFP